ncbi:MAG: putative lipid II flippase FtsW [Pseudomonadota bacterium]
MTSVAQSKSGPSDPWLRAGLDPWLLVSGVALLGLGVVMVASSSLHKLADAPFFFLQRHLISVVLALLGSLVVLSVPMSVWEKTSTTLYFAVLALLVVVLIPGVGREANGAVRWIPIGSFNLQASEFMKLAITLYLAGYLKRRQAEVAYSVWAFIRPMILLVLASALIVLQPDFGTSAVMVATALGMLFLGGVPLWQFSIFFAMAATTLVGLILAAPYRLQRVSSFIDPFDDPLNTDYQLSNALIAFGRGEWFGVGLGNGIQKHVYLPEAHNDFLLAIVGEEFGFLGTAIVILLFAVIMWRAFGIGAAAENRGARFSAYVAYGGGLLISIQAFVNMGVNLGMLPTKGLTLPLVSYGGNSIIVSTLIVALVLRVHYENSAGQQSGGRKWIRA